MWKLYEIDIFVRESFEAAEQFVDHETGEIPDGWAKFLDEVQMIRDDKALAVAAYIREQLAESEAVKSEAKRLAMRARICENKAERLKNYLAGIVKQGEKLKNATVQIGWRKSSVVCIDNEAVLPESCFKVIREVSKTAVKDAITSGELKQGAHIEERQNIQIK